MANWPPWGSRSPPPPWEILKANGIEPAPQRDHQSCSGFLRGQAHAILAADFFQTPTLTGARLYVFAVIEHATRRIRVLGATAHPSTTWTAQLARNLVMDLQDAGTTMKYLIGKLRSELGRREYPCAVDRWPGMVGGGRG